MSAKEENNPDFSCFTPEIYDRIPFLELLADATIEHASPPLLNMLGMKLNDVRGRNLFHILIFDDPEEARANFTALMLHNNPDIFLRCKLVGMEDTRFCAYGTTSYLAPEEKTRILLMECENKRCSIMMALIYHARQEKEKLFAIFEDANDGMALAREDGRLLMVNEALCNMVGRHKTELVGQMHSILHPPEEIGGDGLSETFKKHMDGESSAVETTLISRDGRRIEVEIKAKHMRMDGRNIILGTFRDVTEKNRTIRDLKESEKRFQSLFQTAGDAVIICDEEGKIISWNHSAEALFGMDAREAMGRDMKKMLKLEHDTKIGTGPTIPGETVQNPKIMVETTATRGDGSTFHAELSIAAWKQGDETYQTIILRDTTGWVETEKEALEELQNRELLLKEVHHRVKNNLQIISSLLSLQGRRAENEEVQIALDESQNRIRAIALVHEKLYSSDTMDEVNMADYIPKMVTYLLSSLTTTKTIIPEVDVSDVNIKISNAVPCGIILNELISNAIKHAFPQGGNGRIQIEMTRVGENGESVIMSVSDDGIGFPEGKDFRNTDSLGMKLVVTLTEQLKGDIMMERRETGGTLFTIKFSEGRGAA